VVLMATNSQCGYSGVEISDRQKYRMSRHVMPTNCVTKLADDVRFFFEALKPKRQTEELMEMADTSRS
jgi:hypothetical protein